MFLATKKTGHLYTNSYDPGQGRWLPGGTECTPEHPQKDRQTPGGSGEAVLKDALKRSIGKDGGEKSLGKR